MQSYTVYISHQITLYTSYNALGGGHTDTHADIGIKVISRNQASTFFRKCKANQKQQLLTKKFDIKLRPRSLKYNDIMLTI